MTEISSQTRTGTDKAALVLRVIIGALFLAHLYWKFEILPGGIGHWWANFAINGYPGFVPYYVFSVEVLGAVLFIPGIYTRWVALYALPMMLGAAQYWLARKGFYFTGAGAELPLVWSALLVLQVFLGDGLYAVRVPELPMPRILARITG